MGAGKTSVGRALAEMTGWPLLDNDALVSERNGRDAATTAATAGQPALHRAEADALRTSLAGPSPVIVAVAGSVVEDGSLRRAMRAAGYVVWLRASVDTLLLRIGPGIGRRREAVDGAWLADRARARESLYGEVADLVIDVDERSVADVAAMILAAVAEPSAG